VPCTHTPLAGSFDTHAPERYVAPVGSHRLRHALASELLRQGAALPEISQVLRHRNLNSTTIYAKVDRIALRLAARPWPGAER
jgi:site-specific recombinase XerD